MKLEVFGEADVKNRLYEVSNAVERAGGDAMYQGALLIRDMARSNARQKLNKNPTGNLENHIVVKGSKGAYEVGVWGVVYAGIHEFGGWIKARGRPLHFVIDGKHYQAQAVYIPARPYMRPAFDEGRAKVEELVAAEIARSI